MPGFQTKALVVTSVSGDNFRLISACTKLTEMFPPALKDYLENTVVMFKTRPCGLYRNIFNNEHVFTCKEFAHC